MATIWPINANWTRLSANSALSVRPEGTRQGVEVRAVEDVGRLQRGRGLHLAPRRGRFRGLIQQHVGQRQAAAVIEREDELSGQPPLHLGDAEADRLVSDAEHGGRVAQRKLLDGVEPYRCRLVNPPAQRQRRLSRPGVKRRAEGL
ncbi:MAG: hypothetical protein ACYS15_03685, partial [Planctomycetota bacterium]